MYPVLLDFGPFSVRTLWLILSIGFLISTIILFKTVQHNRLDLNFLWEKQISLLLFSLLGARLAFLLFNWDLYFPLENFWRIFRLVAIYDQGLSLWGGIFTFFLFFYWQTKKTEENTYLWLDSFTYPLLILLAFGSIGDFFEGNNYGQETSLPWGITFNSISIKYTVPIHPTQIYAFLYILGLIFILKYYLKTKPFFRKEGRKFAIALNLYTGLRFLEEFLRGDDVVMIFFFRLSQLISLFLFLISSFYLYQEYKKYKKENLTSKSEEENLKIPPVI